MLQIKCTSKVVALKRSKLHANERPWLGNAADSMRFAFFWRATAGTGNIFALPHKRLIVIYSHIPSELKLSVQPGGISRLPTSLEQPWIGKFINMRNLRQTILGIWFIYAHSSMQIQLHSVSIEYISLYLQISIHTYVSIKLYVWIYSIQHYEIEPGTIGGFHS